jgi:hypothetical protein
MGGRSVISMSCPNCGNSGGCRILRDLPTKKEKRQGGQNILLVRKKCKCNICKHGWVEMERVSWN